MIDCTIVMTAKFSMSEVGYGCVYGVAQSRTQLKWLSSIAVGYGIPNGAGGKEPACQCRNQKMQIQSLD